MAIFDKRAELTEEDIKQKAKEWRDAEPKTPEGTAEQVTPNKAWNAPPKPIDPWQHRSSMMRCITCMWSLAKTHKVGRCKKNAPTISGYPVVFLEDDWCGQHKLDETKV